MLNDLSHWFGSDLATDNTGDLLTSSGDERTQQRILRRMLTNPGGYIAHPKYGAGLLRYIGTAINVAEVTAVIRGQMALEDSVAQSPAPVISVTQTQGNVSAFYVQINYMDSTTNSASVLSFGVTQNGIGII